MRVPRCLADRAPCCRPVAEGVKVATPWVHLPRLTVELPEEGWAVSESALLTSPGGTDITAATSRPPDGPDSLALAHRHLQMLIDTLPGFSESSLTETTAFAGAPAVARRFGFERDGGEWCGRVVYSIVDDAACTVSAAWPAELLTRPEPIR